MTKLEQLAAAYGATEKGFDGKWESTGVVVCITADGGMDYLLHGLHADGVKNDPNVEFAALAHQAMPDLLEAADQLSAALEWIETGEVDGVRWDQATVVSSLRDTLEKLK